MKPKISFCSLAKGYKSMWGWGGGKNRNQMERLPFPTCVGTLWWKSHENEVTGTIRQRLAEARAPGDSHSPSPLWISFLVPV